MLNVVNAGRPWDWPWLCGLIMSNGNDKVVLQPTKKARMLMVTVSKTFTHNPVSRDKECLPHLRLPSRSWAR